MYSKRQRVTAREWRMALVAALLLMGLTTIPYVLGFALQRDGDQFSGFLFGTTDGNSYLAKMREGADGDGLFHLVYTSEPHDDAWLFVPYLLAGKVATVIARPADPAFVTAMLLVFHTARILFGVLAILASYWFAAQFLPRGNMRWLALVLISVGGGLGWLLTLMGLGEWLGSLPVDFYMPEAYTFLMLYGLPHLALARAMLLIGFGLLGTRTDLRSALLAGICWLIMALCVPFDVAVVYALLGAWGAALTLRTQQVPVRWAIRPVIAALIPAPFLLYNLIVVGQNPAFALFNAQNKLPSPNPIQYVFAFGVLAIPAYFGARWAWRRSARQPAYALLVAWVIVAPLLAYTPLSVQRRLLEGLFAPLCVLAIAGLRLVIAPRWARQRWFRRRRWNTRRVWQWVSVGVLLLTVPTSCLLLVTGMLAVVTHSPSVYHPAGEIAALDWLNAHAPRSAVVLSSFDTGNYLPARTDLRAFLGHGVETLHSEQKQVLVRDYFNGLKTLAEIQAPDQDPIRYVFFGPAEAVLDPDPAPSQWMQSLTLVYQQGDYRIYRTPDATFGPGLKPPG